MFASENQHYRSYLLRMWRANIEGEWRMSLQNVATGECQNFSTLDEMVAYIKRRMREEPEEGMLAMYLPGLSEQEVEG